MASLDDDTLTTPCLLQYVAQWPQHRDWVMNVLHQDGSNLEHLAGTPFPRDKGTVLAAVSNCGGALQFASQQLRSDKEVVLQAVNSDPFALVFASQQLKASPDIVLAALRRDPAALSVADKGLFQCPDFMLSAVQLDATAVTYAAPCLLSDSGFRAAAKAANPYVGHWFVNTEHFPGLQTAEAQQSFKNDE